MKPARFTLLLLIIVVSLTWPAAAQSVYGQLWGRLTSGSGAIISGAVVTVTSVQTGARVKTKSDEGGYFTLNNLVPDLYQIEVRADGFKSARGTVAVSADSATTVNSSLQAGDPNVIADTVAEGSILKLDRTDVSTFFDSRTINELPLLDRNLTELLTLVPGAARGQLFIPSNENPQSGMAVNLNGQHFSGSAFQLDGTEDRDPLEGIVVINPNLDSVREVKVTTQGYNAEFGQATAGVTTIQTRTGSNSWHGDGFGFRRTGWGQTTDPFAAAGVPPGKHKIFGGAVGGPLLRNKLFIFGDYEGTRIGQGANVLLNVPPNDSAWKTCLAGGNCDLSDYAGFVSGKLHDDKQHGSTVFKNNVIPGGPSGRISPAALAILSFLPPPNYTSPNPSCGDATVCDNYLASGQEVFRGDEFDVRTDYNVSSALRFFGRYSFGDFLDTGAPAFGPAAGGYGINPSGYAGVARTRNQGISAGFTDSLTPRLLTDFRFGFFRYRLNNDSQDNGQTPNIGIKNIFTADTGDPFANGMPDIEIPSQPSGVLGSRAGFGGDYLRLGYSTAVNSCNCPFREREQQFQFANNWTRSAGKHVVRWGADLRFLQNYTLSSDRRRTGYFDFFPSTTGLGLATLLIGDVGAFERDFSSPAVLRAEERQKRMGFYGQDTWRVNSRLTVNFGLRWEIYFPQTVTGAGAGGFLVPDFHNTDPTSTYINAPPAVGTNGQVSNNLTNFAPRLGFAFLLNPTTVMRAGYGRSFDAGYGGAIFGIGATQNPPVTVDQSVQPLAPFNLDNGPPPFTFPTGSRFSLMDLAAKNIGNPGSASPVAPSGAFLYALASRVQVPTVDSWNLTVQHELTSRMYFELAYVGSKGTHIFADNGAAGAYYLLSQPTLNGVIMHIYQNGQPVLGSDPANCRVPPVPASTQDYCLSIPAIRSFFQRVEIPNDPCPGETGGKTKCYFQPDLFPVRYFGNGSSDNFNSLQARVQKNFSRGYSFMAHYTWSKGFDYDSNYFRVDPSVGYGPTPFDISHRFVMTNIWDLPFGRGRALFGGAGPTANRFLAGWTIAAITIWRSGIPFTPSYTRTNCAHDTDSGDPCRPNLVGPVHISGSRSQYFTTTGGQALQPSCVVSGAVDCAPGTPASQQGYNLTTGQSLLGQTIGPWQRPGDGQIGNVGRDSFRGPGFFQSDIAVAKTLTITERASLAFRADVFNVFNRVNLGNPNACVDCQQGAGVISSLAQGAIQREFQFSLRVSF